jgi:hypothetical protein
MNIKSQSNSSINSIVNKDIRKTINY